MQRSAHTALGSARARFIEGLPKRAEELRAAVQQLGQSPGDQPAHEDMRRRLHALYATSQVFEEERLARAVKQVISQLDAARDAGRELDAEALQALAELAAGLPGYIDADDEQDPAPPGSTDVGDVGPLNDVGSADRAPRSRAAASVMQATHDVMPLEARREDARDRSVALTQSVAGSLPAPAVTGVLVIDTAAVRANVRRLLPEDRFEVWGSDDPEEAIRLLHVDSPDFAFVSGEIASLPDVDLVRRLQTDPLSDVRAVYLLLPEGATYDAEFLRQTGADGVLVAPLDQATLAALVQARTHFSRRAFGALAALSEGTAEDVAARFAEEIRRGIADSLQAGRNEKIHFEDSTELMAAAWSAIGRVRSHLAEQSRGRIRFRSGALADAPALLSLGEDRSGRDADASFVQRGFGADGASSRDTESGLATSYEGAAGSARTTRGDADASSAARNAAVSGGAYDPELNAAAHGGDLDDADDAVREVVSIAAPDPDAGFAASLAGRRVLVADDDPAVLWFFAGLAREAGAQVLEAQNGRQALELARRKRPHVIISDILMPKIDGFALCREIKRDALLWHVPVILLSWKEDFLQRMRELDSGANGYLRKEAGSRQIIAGLAEVLRPRTRLEQHLRAGGEVRGRIEGLGVSPLLETVALERPNARVTVRDAWNLFEVDLRGRMGWSVTRTAADGSFARGDKALLQLIGVTSGRFAVMSSETPLRSLSSVPLDKALLEAGKHMGALLDAVSDTRLVHVALMAFDDEVVASLLHATPTPLAEVVYRFRSGVATANEMLQDGSFSPGDLEEYLRELARRGAISGVWNSQGDDLIALAARERDERPGVLLHSSIPPRDPARAAAARELMRPPATAAASQPRSLDQALFEHDAVEPEPSPLELHFPSRPPLPSVRVRASTVPYGVNTLESEAAVRQAVLAAAPGTAVDLKLTGLDSPPPPPPAAGSSGRRDGLGLVLTLGVLMLIGYVSWQRLERSSRDAEGSQTPSSTALVLPPPPAAQSAAAGLVRPLPPAAISVQEPLPTSIVMPAHAVQVIAPDAGAMVLPDAGRAGAVAASSSGDLSSSNGFGRVLPYIDASHGVSVRADQGLLVVEVAEGAGDAPRIYEGEHALGRPPIAIALDAGRHELALRNGSETSFRYVLIRAGETRLVTLSGNHE